LLLKRMLGVPLVTTLTGTDINVDLKNPERRRIIKEVLDVSDQVTVFNDHALSVLIKTGIQPSKIRVIHQSVLMPKGQAMDYRTLYGVTENERVFLMSGGIRRVKRIGYAIDTLSQIKKVRPEIRLFIAGLVLEQEEYQRIAKRIRHLPWLNYLGQVPREHMPSLLKSVDVVVNTSASESEANAILEAFYFQKPVVARSIPGNSSLLTNKTGFLFHNKKEFYEKILYVIDHPAGLARVRKEVERLMRTTFSFAGERSGYASVYETLIGQWRKKE